MVPKLSHRANPVIAKKCRRKKHFPDYPYKEKGEKRGSK